MDLEMYGTLVPASLYHLEDLQKRHLTRAYVGERNRV